MAYSKGYRKAAEELFSHACTVQSAVRFGWDREQLRKALSGVHRELDRIEGWLDQGDTASQPDPGMMPVMTPVVREE